MGQLRAFAIILSVTNREIAGATCATSLSILLRSRLHGLLRPCHPGPRSILPGVRADDFLIKDAEVRFADKSLGLEYNPRLRESPPSDGPRQCGGPQRSASRVERLANYRKAIATNTSNSALISTKLTGCTKRNATLSAGPRVLLYRGR